MYKRFGDVVDENGAVLGKVGVAWIHAVGLDLQYHLDVVAS